MSYWLAHRWVKYHFGAEKRCEDCGLSETPVGMKYYFDWANISSSPSPSISLTLQNDQN